MKINVLMPTFNRPQWAQEAIDSVLSQEGVDVTIHVLDNGSGPDTAEALQKYKDNPKVKLYRVEENIKKRYIYLAERCDPDSFIVLFADDDRMLPGNLKKKHDALVAEDAWIVHSTAHTIDQEGSRTGLIRGERGKPVTFEEMALTSQIFMTTALVLGRYCLNALREADEYGCFIDWYLWMKYMYMSENPPIFIDEPLTEVRIHPDSDTHITGYQNGEFLNYYPKMWSYTFWCMADMFGPSFFTEKFIRDVCEMYFNHKMVHIHMNYKPPTYAPPNFNITFMSYGWKDPIVK